MSQISKLLIALIVSLSLVANAYAEEMEEEHKGWGVSTSVGVFSDYIFRGKTVYDGTSIQPSVTGYLDFDSYGRLATNLWMHVSGETNEPPEKFTELDTTFSYDVTLADMVNLSGGFILYRFPGDTGRISDTEEYFLGLGFDVPTNPSVHFFHDYEEGRYQYMTLSFNHTFDMREYAENLYLTPYTTFGFATNADDGPVFYTDDGLQHIDVGLLADMYLGSVIVTPSIHFTFETDDGANNEFWFGIEVSYDV